MSFLLVRTRIYERLATPPSIDVHNKIHHTQQHKGHGAHAGHIGQRPRK